jgi:hypothetical protein
VAHSGIIDGQQANMTTTNTLSDQQIAANN